MGFDYVYTKREIAEKGLLLLALDCHLHFYEKVESQVKTFVVQHEEESLYSDRQSMVVVYGPLTEPHYPEGRFVTRSICPVALMHTTVCVHTLSHAWMETCFVSAPVIVGFCL